MTCQRGILRLELLYPFASVLAWVVRFPNPKTGNLSRPEVQLCIFSLFLGCVDWPKFTTCLVWVVILVILMITKSMMMMKVVEMALEMELMVVKS